MNKKALIGGILLLVGGVVWAYWGYFLQPDVFIYAVGLSGIAGILGPVAIVFLGIFLIWYGSSSNNSQ